MNIHTTFENAINEVLAITLKDEKGFFEKQVIPKLKAVSDLMRFTHIHHSAFHEYLGLFRNDIRLDIDACAHLPNTASLPEKEALLKLIQCHVKAKMSVVVFAFSYYLQNRALLYKEEKDSGVFTMNRAPKDGFGSSVIYSK